MRRTLVPVVPERGLRRVWSAFAVLTTALLATPAFGQAGHADSLKADSLRRFTLEPIAVSATRSDLPLTHTPNAVHLLDRSDISFGRPTMGPDEALAQVPGVYAANRYNYSVDQRISIRGFGARAAFALRGIKVLMDGIPQTLPDGQGQLTNLELGEADRIEVLRGSSSALFGNAAGGVISVWTDPVPPRSVSEEIKITGGTFDTGLDRGWTKWIATTRARVGQGAAQLSLSRLAFSGERQHSDADLRNLNTHLAVPLGNGWSLNALVDAGDDPKAGNPGALTAVEMARNRDSAAAVNLTTRAGKDVSQVQGGATLRRRFASGGEARWSRPA